MTCEELHPLHSVDFVTEYIIEHGKYPVDRRTGRTTAGALVSLSWAILQPDKVVEFPPHPGEPTSNACAQHRLGRLFDMARDLKLEHIWGRVVLAPDTWDARVEVVFRKKTPADSTGSRWTTPYRLHRPTK